MKYTIRINMVSPHADALQLPFKEKTFVTILSENLLHCLNDTHILLKQLLRIVSENGRIFYYVSEDQSFCRQLP